MIETTYSNARTHLKRYFDQAVDDRETILVRRRGKGDVAIIAADELESLKESAYLLRSPANASRLLAALDESRRGENRLELISRRPMRPPHGESVPDASALAELMREPTA